MKKNDDEPDEEDDEDDIGEGGREVDNLATRLDSLDIRKVRNIRCLKARTLTRQRKTMIQAARRQRVSAQVGVPNSEGSMLTRSPCDGLMVIMTLGDLDLTMMAMVLMQF